MVTGRALAGLLLVLGATACGSRLPGIQDMAVPVREVPFPRTSAVGLAWPATDELVVTLSADGPGDTWSTHRLRLPDGRLTELDLPARPECRRTRYSASGAGSYQTG